jgi:hypothetical protein
MAVNLDKPHLWKQDTQASVDHYNRWFMKFVGLTGDERAGQASRGGRQSASHLCLCRADHAPNGTRLRTIGARSSAFIGHQKTNATSRHPHGREFALNSGPTCRRPLNGCCITLLDINKRRF